MNRLLTATAALAVLAGPALAQDTIRMGTEGAYPPYNFINDAGEIDGFERELGDEMCARAGLTCEWVTNDWDSIIPNLVSGNYDTIIAGMSITDERDEVIDFTQAYMPPDPSTYVGLAGTEIDPTTAVIAAQTGTIQAAHIAAIGGALMEFPTPDDTIAAVRNGEADAVLADSDYLAPIVEASGGELDYVAPDVMLGGGIGMGVRESDTELKAAFDAVITEMKEDGTLNPMIVKWFGEDAQVWE
jgi:polar amino acid transport system substrate-binding protein